MFGLRRHEHCRRCGRPKKRGLDRSQRSEYLHDAAGHAPFDAREFGSIISPGEDYHDERMCDRCFRRQFWANVRELRYTRADMVRAERKANEEVKELVGRNADLQKIIDALKANSEKKKTHAKV